MLRTDATTTQDGSNPISTTLSFAETISFDYATSTALLNACQVGNFNADLSEEQLSKQLNEMRKIYDEILMRTTSLENTNLPSEQELASYFALINAIKEKMPNQKTLNLQLLIYEIHTCKAMIERSYKNWESIPVPTKEKFAEITGDSIDVIATELSKNYFQGLAFDDVKTILGNFVDFLLRIKKFNADCIALNEGIQAIQEDTNYDGLSYSQCEQEFEKNQVALRELHPKLANLKITSHLLKHQFNLRRNDEGRPVFDSSSLNVRSEIDGELNRLTECLLATITPHVEHLTKLNKQLIAYPQDILVMFDHRVTSMHGSSDEEKSVTFSLYQDLSTSAESFFSRYNLILKELRNYHNVDLASLSGELERLFSTTNNKASEITKKLFNALFFIYPMDFNDKKMIIDGCIDQLHIRNGFLKRKMNEYQKEKTKYFDVMLYERSACGNPSNIDDELFERFKDELVILLLRMENRTKDQYIEEIDCYKKVYARYVQLAEIYKRITEYERHLIRSAIPLANIASSFIGFGSAAVDSAGSVSVGSVLNKSKEYVDAEKEVTSIIYDQDLTRLHADAAGLKEKIYVMQSLHDIVSHPVYTSEKIIESLKSFFAAKHVADIIATRRGVTDVESQKMQREIMDIIEGKTNHLLDTPSSAPSTPPTPSKSVTASRLSRSSSILLPSPKPGSIQEPVLSAEELRDILRLVSKYESYLIGTKAPIAERILSSPVKFYNAVVPNEDSQQMTFTKSQEYIDAEKQAEDIFAKKNVARLNTTSVGLIEKIYVVKRLQSLLSNSSGDPIKVETVRAFFREPQIAKIVTANRDGENILPSFMPSDSQDMYDKIMKVIENRKSVSRKLF